MSVTDTLIANNEAYAAQFSGPLPLPPSKHVAVLACMDARLDVYRALGLNEGEAHVIRNAGGVVTTWDGGEAEAGGNIVAAATPQLHAAALELLNGGK